MKVFNNVVRGFSLVMHDPKGSHYKASFMLGEHMNENAWYLLGITIVLLDSFQIYVNNSFIEVIYRNNDTTIIASPSPIESGISGRSSPVEDRGLPRPDKSGLAMTLGRGSEWQVKLRRDLCV